MSSSIAEATTGNLPDSGRTGVRRNASHPAGPGAAINRHLFGLFLFLGTETMFFAGLISTHLILRAGNVNWPPAGQPRLTPGLTAVNTLVLVLSGYTMWLALRAIRAGNRNRLVGWTATTLVLGLLFMGIQGYEWTRLLGYGLTVSSSTYGAIFYTLIGAHGIHVLAALAILIFTLVRASGNRYSPAMHQGVLLCETYWLFVVGLWPILYVLVYLT